MKRLFFLLLIASFLGSCTVNKDIMFRTPEGYDYNNIPNVDSLEYTISPNDRLEFRLLTNDGYKLVDLTGDQGQGQNSQQAIRQFGVTYLVEVDGQVKLPTLGRVQIAGYTIREAEALLEERYSEFYVKPFIQISVNNYRVIVSPGDGGEARVIPIINNMTVIEALSRAGGIANRGNASKVKVIRDMDTHKEVYLLDLSRLETMEEGYMVVQANDIIYVEPNPEIVREVLRDLTPVISLITSTLFLISLIGTN